MAASRGARQLAALAVALWAALAAATDDVPIATFDGAQGTTLHWETVNDPVMGGRSSSTFKDDAEDKIGTWAGEVRIVPFLGKPGFCTLQSPGFREVGHFPDLSGTSGLVVRLAQSLPDGISNFSVQLRSAHSRESVYGAAFSATADREDHFLPWAAFKCSWRGQPDPRCPEFTSQLGRLSGVGLSTYFPQEAPGEFNVQIESISARGAASRPLPSEDTIRLEDFAAHKMLHIWHTENDPVMGGQSDSTFTRGDLCGDYQGTCRIVPKLQAPGFTIVMTENPLFARFPDVSSMDGLSWRIKKVGGNITHFKIAFCSTRNYFKCQFASFKADFDVPENPSEYLQEYTDVFLPWHAFSNQWDPKTGKHTGESPPTEQDLRSITQLQLWVEGVAGDFHLQIASVDATPAPEQAWPQIDARTAEKIFV